MDPADDEKATPCDEDEKLSPPEEFKFPFPPYKIQDSFMTNLYRTLEEGKMGVFESPTGTGKSLSLVCAALTWLLDHEARQKRCLKTKASSAQLSLDAASGDDWLDAQSNLLKEKEHGRKARKVLTEIEEREIKIGKYAKRKFEMERELAADAQTKGPSATKSKIDAKKSGATEEKDSEDDLVLDDLDGSNLEEADECLPDVDQSSYKAPKIFFCSRTHSQLAQVVNEVKKLPFAADLRIISLASRQSYCINQEVLQLNNQSLINQRCLELREAKLQAPVELGKKKVKVQRCPFLNPRSLELLHLTTMTKILDVEAIVKKGKEVKGCPYYSTRSALQDAQLVFLPYNTLLHESTRKSSGIDLKGNVVIVDEAHNLLDTIAHIHSVELSGAQLQECLDQLQIYDQRYHSKLSAKNLLSLSQLRFVVQRFIYYIESKEGAQSLPGSEAKGFSQLLSLEQFLGDTQVDRLKPLELVKFAEDKKLALKLKSCKQRYSAIPLQVPPAENNLQAFLKRVSESSHCKNSVGNPRKRPAPGSDPEAPSKSDKVLSTVSTARGSGWPSGSSRGSGWPVASSPAVPSKLNKDQNAGMPLHNVLSFLTRLMTPTEDARIVVTHDKKVLGGSIKIILLNPGSAFTPIVQEARSVIVAGGTMQPVTDFTQQLFQTVKQGNVTIFSCGHVVPPHHVLPIIVPAGPSNVPLILTYQKRLEDSIVNEVGRCIVNLTRVVPAGMVVFFPSYNYEKLVVEKWTKSGILASIEAKKKVFREPKSTGDVETVLGLYGAHIKQCSSSGQQTGAIILSVVGGKLSEGINFSDDLGRCVVVVGLPYANSQSAELKARMTYLNNNFPPTPSGVQPGQAYYEDLCMKAVNQCIGRAVRHRGDYACMILLDQRYGQKHVQDALPSWISGRLVTCPNFGPVCGRVKNFFNQMNSQVPS